MLVSRVNKSFWLKVMNLTLIMRVANLFFMKIKKVAHEMRRQQKKVALAQI